MKKTLEQRLWEKVRSREPGQCWLWTGATNNVGVGLILRNRKLVTAHRVVAELCGKPSMSRVENTCGNKSCVNPDHYADLAAMEIVRFTENYVESASGCWEWTGDMTESGYGRMFFRGRMEVAHRVGYVLHRGPIGDGLCACHTCDNRRCVNPSHIFLGTKADNSADMVAKGRSLTGNRNPSRVYPERRARGERHGMNLHPERRTNGERNRHAVLTAEIVLEMRSDRANGLSYAQIAEKHGVPYGMAYKAVTGLRWSHLAVIKPAVVKEPK